MTAEADRAPDERIERACEVMHDAYERAAADEGWETQERSRKPWPDVPEANKATMRAAVRALIEHLDSAADRARAEVQAAVMAERERIAAAIYALRPKRDDLNGRAERLAYTNALSAAENVARSKTAVHSLSISEHRALARAGVQAPARSLADKWQALHDRVCKGTDETTPIHLRHPHDCGIVGQEAATELRAALGDTAALDRMLAEARAEAAARAVDEFVEQVAFNHAHNGADDPGQRFYDWGLNQWLAAIPNPHRCHCGKPVHYGHDGDLTHHRGMCRECDLVRCDAYPGACRAEGEGA